jgi:phosphinothricin acetyltransferase
MIIRAATLADADALAAIYGHHVAHGLGTFEEVAPSPQTMAERLRQIGDLGLPYLIALIDGAIVGFAYAAPFRTRAAYRYTVEDSVYVAPGRQNRGIGKALLTAVIAACEPLGLRQMVAMIGDAQNAGSIGVHRACGFVHAGVLAAVGYKAGRWVDVVIMRRPLNGGEVTPPQSVGLDLSAPG